MGYQPSAERKNLTKIGRDGKVPSAALVLQVQLRDDPSYDSKHRREVNRYLELNGHGLPPATGKLSEGVSDLEAVRRIPISLDITSLSTR